MRKSEIKRTTKETSINLSLCLDGGPVKIETGIGFLNHMLELFAHHGGFGLKIKASGDTDVDFHHTTEDIGISLGKAFREACANKGINRYGSILLPMDETLVETVTDFGGRAYIVWNVEFPTPKVGDFDTELIEEFWTAFAHNAACNLHVNLRYGKNSHHIAEAIFKSAARSLKSSLQIVSDKVNSTKGIIE